MKPRLSKAASQLREQIDDSFPDRDRVAAEAEAATKAQAKAELLAKLGITAEEAALLLG